MKEYLEDGDFNLMGTAEQFSWEYSKVGQLADRLKCFQTLVDFEPKKVDLMPDIATLQKCSKFICEDKRIEKFCEVKIIPSPFFRAASRGLNQPSARLTTNNLNQDLYPTWSSNGDLEDPAGFPSRSCKCLLETGYFVNW